MSRQYFQDLIAEPPLANLTAVTATTETALWAAATYTPIPAYDANRVGKVYICHAGGIYSTGASGTLTITPRWGTSTGGTTMGASIAQTVPVSLTNEAWIMDFYMVVRTNGATGTAMGTGSFRGGGAAATAASSCLVAFGGTSATVDTTTAQGLTIGWTLSVAGSVTPQWVTWQTAN